MIGKLTGIVDRINGSHVILDVNGVGYVVTCSKHTLHHLQTKEPASLLIETHVREDAINLYGFSDAHEQDWFKLLTTVQGVGAKVALSILGSVSSDKLASVIAAQDKAELTQAEGVGPKLALRLVTELKDKVPAFSDGPILRSSLANPAPTLDVGLTGDAISALTNLGYRRAEAFAVVASVNRHHKSAPLDELIRLSLLELSRGSNAA